MIKLRYKNFLQTFSLLSIDLWLAQGCTLGFVLADFQSASRLDIIFCLFLNCSLGWLSNLLAFLIAFSALTLAIFMILDNLINMLKNS